MAYSKSKYVEAAQKLLNQGKVPQAIAEYQQILKYEPKDQVTLMTIGELYIRQGETFQAMDYFERLAQIFVGDGFLTKAIAVYKRIAKLAPDEIRPLEKLADLYVQQGVMSEARPIFLQLAEINLKNNRKSEAVALLKKLLLAEPDNLRIQIRLADLYTAMGQTKDAVEAYVGAAQRALARGDQAECEKLADRALKLDPKSQAAVIVKARIHSSQGNTEEATKTLQTVADLHKGGEQTELLLDLYLKDSNWEDAVALAIRVFDADEKNFAPAQKVVEALLQAGEGEQALSVVKQIYPAMGESGDKDAVGNILTDLAAAVPSRMEPLEWQAEFFERHNDPARLGDALARLGDLLAGAKKYDRAKEVFEKLVQADPSDASKRKLNAVLKKLGHKVQEAPAGREEEEAAVELALKPPPKLPTEMDAEAPEVRAKPAGDSGDASLDPETQKFIEQSLTDVDLFASYGLAHKAMGLLEAILRRAPHHTPTLEKLLDFVLGAGDDKRTAELAAQLEQLHTERGDVASAERFTELRKRFQRAAGLSDEQIAASVTPTPPPAPAVEPEPASPEIEEVEVASVSAEEEEQPSGGEEVHEVDLSDEWASLLKESQPPEPAAPSKKAAATPPPAASSDVTEFEIPVETPEVSEEDLTEQLAAQAPPEPEPPPPPPKKARATPPPPPPKAKEKPKPAEPEPEADQDYELVLESPTRPAAKEHKPPKAPPRAPAPAAPAPAAKSGLGEDFLADLAHELDQLGVGEPAPPRPPAPAASRAKAAGPAKPSGKAIAPQKPPIPSDGSPLKEVFDEFRAELGEMGAEDEDLETHYNLGIAFREMGLLEEAISEFQKVAQANDRGREFRYAMQCSTLLGVTFMEKGQPGVAAIWYERALQTPNLDPESDLALRYDLGVAQESAGDLDAALKSFSQVYARNIDYRDVGERIAALQKPAR